MQGDWYQLSSRDNQSCDDIRGIKSRHTNAVKQIAQADENVMGQAQSFNLKATQNERLINNFDSNQV